MEQLLEAHQFESETVSNKRVYKKGEVIYYEDTPAFGFYYIKSGTVKIFSSDNTGKEVILRLASSGDIFGHGNLLGHKNHMNSAQAIEESTCHFIDGNEFHNLMMRNPALMVTIMKKVGRELTIIQDRCVDLMKKNVRERLASYFHYMTMYHSEHTDQGMKIRIHLSREEIASIIGTAHETAIRFIGEFKEMGLIREEDRFFYILDQERLRSLGRLH